MTKKYYKKEAPKNRRRIAHILGICLALFGLCLTTYVFLPVMLWEFFLAPVFASQSLVVPIPQTTLVTPASIKDLIFSQASILAGTDYNNASNWFPSYVHPSTTPRIASYTVSIPTLNIIHADVSTVDEDLAHHLVNFQGTCVPPEKGNCVIFGHSTLPQLYNPNDYKTIFANVHNLHIGDSIIVYAENVEYTYKIFSMVVVDPEDTSVLAQTLDDSYLTVITCTPPGTVWKRLVIKARLQKLL